MAFNSDKNAYHDWLNSQNIPLHSDNLEVTESLASAEPDLVAAPEEPTTSPELAAAIEVIQEGGLQHLTTIQQKVFQNSVVEGMSLREVAELLGITHSTVQEHLEAIGRKLRPLVEDKL